jgi:hypothetical protein
VVQEPKPEQLTIQGACLFEELLDFGLPEGLALAVTLRFEAQMLQNRQARHYLERASRGRGANPKPAAR